MREKFLNQYRIASSRIKDWDYGINASYFVTICTKHRKHYFGHINKDMNLSPMGEVAESMAQLMATQFPFITVDAFVVMPNHIHGIFTICKQDNKNGLTDRSKKGGITGLHNRTLYENLSQVVRWYKGRTCYECRKLFPAFAWQSRFHEHIVRNQASFDKISEYIINNPKKWSKDCFFKDSDH